MASRSGMIAQIAMVVHTRGGAAGSTSAPMATALMACVHDDGFLEIAGLLPDVTAERTEHHDVEAIELDVAVVAFLDVPDEDALAESVVGRLGP